MWIRVGALCVSPYDVILKVCVCVFPLEIFPPYTAQVNCELSKHFSSPLPTDYTLPDSFLNSAIPRFINIHFPQMKMQLRKMAQALVLLSGKAKWEPMGLPVFLVCTPHLNWSLILEILVMNQGGPCIYVYTWRYYRLQRSRPCPSL